MKTYVAIEVSSTRGSLALFPEGGDPRERTWVEDRVRNQHLFEEFEALLHDASVEPASISGFVVGRGPGTFSNLRIALSLARAAALPGGGFVYAVSSGEALAAEVMASSGAGQVAVVGDARRGSLWYAVFERGPDGLPCPAAWALCTAETFLADIPTAALAVTSSWDRLRAALPPEVFSQRTWIEEDRFPGAPWLGRLYEDRRQAGVPSEPLTPLYMHPPVR